MTQQTVKTDAGVVLERLAYQRQFSGALEVTGALTAPGLKTAAVALTAAQVKALAATPVQLVAAPGAGKVLEYLGAVVRLQAGSEALAEDVGGSNLGIKYTDDSGVQVSEEIEMTGFITQTSDYQTRSMPVKDAIVAETGAANQSLVVHNVGAGEITGNASGDAVLEFYVAYRVHTLL